MYLIINFNSKSNIYLIVNYFLLQYIIQFLRTFWCNYTILIFNFFEFSMQLNPVFIYKYNQWSSYNFLLFQGKSINYNHIFNEHI